MQNPAAEIEKIINDLTTTPSSEVQKQTVFKYFTDNAAYDHPLVHLAPGKNSRDNLLNFYRVYHTFTYVHKIEVNSIDFNKENNHLVIDLWETASPKFFLPYTIKMRLIVVLNLDKRGELYFISKQEDYFPLQDIAQIIPFGGLFVRTLKAFNSFVGQAVGTSLHYAGLV
ncbi:hypothetical protein PROFUN_13637 [Planoprotostelium fungivorum]|uniref:SigF-like NTF2-like domain-containing protein n=1 Tax=Planoprotostelium fungivorum TaxID=1890364 RepID=A0A2P6MZZ2_9EUKA|nr:hypothetical protein PROFUN_13637 [Planoprotostelium fungivorum]